MQKHPIVVIDDHPQFCELVTAMLTGTDFAVLPALDEPSRIKLAQTPQPAVIPLDMGIPGVGGIATCKKLKRDRALADIPLVGMTAFSDSMYIPVAFHAGRDGHDKKHQSSRWRFVRRPTVGGPRNLLYDKMSNRKSPLCHLGQFLLGVLFQNKGSMAAKSAEISSPYCLCREFWHDSWTPTSGRSPAQQGSEGFKTLFRILSCREVLPWRRD